jgi:NAD(P)-dependent dehydrogenase (short-subunit alcohol dehydrogenase family)
MSIHDRESLEGERALVTGGARGAGAAIAARLGAAGATAMVTARMLPDGYPSLERFIAPDIATVEGADTVICRLMDEGGVDIVVHNVGGSDAPSGGFAAQPDSDAYFALFADDATVEDEGAEYHGLAAIRQWRAAVPLVHYTITRIEQTPDALVVTTTIAGDFPGSPVSDLKFRFEDYDNHRIRVLRIRL